MLKLAEGHVVWIADDKKLLDRIQKQTRVFDRLEGNLDLAVESATEEQKDELNRLLEVKAYFKIYKILIRLGMSPILWSY